MKTFYSASSAQQIDQYAIQQLGIPGILLMKQAGFFAFQTLQKKFFPSTSNTALKTISVLCGTGNNGGDGFIVAQLAKQAGLTVHIYLFGEANQLKDDALTAYQELQAIGITTTPFNFATHQSTLQQSDVIVDAILGIGLDRPVTGQRFNDIQQINQLNRPVLALDIPSGLHADTGNVLGAAIRATHTCTFITQKIGLYSFQGSDIAGKVHYSPLYLKTNAFQSQTPIAYHHSLDHWLAQRPKPPASQHKGQAGTVCFIGGNHNMMGAIQLAARASLHTGAGLVKVITQTEHTIALTQQQPELMCYDQSQLNAQVQHANVIAIGPGLGLDDWATQCYQAALNHPQPKVMDADALKLLAQTPQKQNNWILTPHPGEAAQLLNTTSQAIQADRIAAIHALHKKYGGIIVLKGNGTLVFDGEQVEICLAGNPRMAVGGMGDTLTGIIATLVTQGLSLWNAACLGVSLHAHAGDQVAQKNRTAVLPSELTLQLCSLVK